jgi:DNA (cytosine-5)-methyltransferase 1
MTLSSQESTRVRDDNGAAPKVRARKGYVNRRARWSDEWATPWDFFWQLDAEFCFGFDAAAQPWSTKCLKYASKNSLGVSWFDPLKPRAVWLNPPYSNIDPWLAKARAEAARGATVVCLLPCVPDRKWWATHVEGHASEVRLVSGKRLYFQSAPDQKPTRAPFPSCVVIYRGAA